MDDSHKHTAFGSMEKGSGNSFGNLLKDEASVPRYLMSRELSAGSIRMSKITDFVTQRLTKCPLAPALTTAIHRRWNIQYILFTDSIFDI